jgi:cell division protease FtsH
MGKQNPIVFVLVLLTLGYMIYMIPRLSQQAQTTTKTYDYYSDFVDDLQSGKIKTVTVVARQRAEGEFAPGAFAGQKRSFDRFTVNVPSSENLTETLRTIAPADVKIAVSSGLWQDRLISIAGNIILPIGLLAFVWLFFMRQMRMGSGQAFNFGRSQAKLMGDNFDRVTFADVAGMQEVKEELKEVVEFLRQPEKFRVLGAKIPRGVLLVGPPGCGKTLLARAVAGEAGVAFFYLSGSDFVEMFVGVGASRVRDLFEQAKTHLPAIIFIDELDAVGRLRGAGLGGGHDEREQTLNALLVEMDGFDPNADVIILAATNRPDILDPALLRPGRFDRRVIVDNPDIKEREAILQIYAKDKPLSPDVDVKVLARRTPGFSGADIENLVNEAALLAARRDKQRIEMVEFDEAVERVIAGPERRSRVVRDKERRVIAYHEAGHALIGNMIPDFQDTYKVTILPRGMALGYSINLPDDDSYLTSRTELINRMTQALGGRAAEELVLGEITTGAANDLEKVSEIARQMVTEFGMSEKMGPMTYGKKHGPIFLARDLAEERNYSEEVARRIDEEIRDLVESCYERAKAILSQHRDNLDRLVEVLLERESLDQAEVASLVKYGRLPDPDADPASEPPRTEQVPSPVAAKDSPRRPSIVPPVLPEAQHP